MKNLNNLLDDMTNASGSASVDAWRDQLFLLGANHGYRYATLAIFQSHEVPVEWRGAYLHTNAPREYLNRYDDENYGAIDPIAVHCMARSTPLRWSSATFSGEQQRKLYGDMQRFDMHSGIAFPYHGPCGEFGILCFLGRHSSVSALKAATSPELAELAYFRDVAMEVFTEFMRSGHGAKQDDIEVTSRELECLKWCAAGKSSWDIAQLMNCTEATVNYHFANIRRKFGASSRRMAVIKAIQLGFLSV